MPTYRLLAQVDSEESQTFLVRSPSVGIADGVPNVGDFLNPNDGFLTLRILNRRYIVQLPHNVYGRVIERFIDDTTTPLAYNQPLFKLSLTQNPTIDAQTTKGASKLHGTNIDSDLIPIIAPSEGVFYRRPSPDSPAYVEEGSEVSIGAVLGLVEVMKSFNPITYSGPSLPERGIVAKIQVNDASEVAFGQVLFLIRDGRRKS